MNNKSIYMISYDIVDDRKRNKVAKLLQQNGYERIQFSVFTGLSSPVRNKTLWLKLQSLVDIMNQGENRIICIAISKNAFKCMNIIGNFTADIEYILGTKHTQIF